MKHIKQIIMEHPLKKYFFPDYTYIGSKQSLISAIRKRKPYTIKELQKYSKQQLYRIFNKIK